MYTIPGRGHGRVVEMTTLGLPPSNSLQNITKYMVLLELPWAPNLASPIWKHPSLPLQANSGPYALLGKTKGK